MGSAIGLTLLPLAVWLSLVSFLLGMAYSDCKHVATRILSSIDKESATLANSDQTAQTSPLLRLPGKVRNKIYREVLVRRKQLSNFDKMTRDLDTAKAIDISLKDIKERTGLLRVCTQLRKEATAKFCTENTFRITHPLEQQVDVALFLQRCGPENAAKIPKTIIDFQFTDPWKSALETDVDRLGQGSEAEIEDRSWRRENVPAIEILEVAARKMARMLQRSGVMIESFVVDAPVVDAPVEDAPVEDERTLSNLEVGRWLISVAFVEVLKDYVEEFIHELEA